MDWPQSGEEFSQQLAVVKAVNILEANGARTIKVSVMSFSDMGIIPDIMLDSPLHMQYVPVVGQYVMILRTANNYTRIVAYSGEKLFDAPLNPGEVMMEGSGGGFVHMNNAGDVIVGDSYLSNVMKVLSGIGITITADGYSLNVKKVGQINITPQDDKLGTEEKIELVKMKGSSVTGRIVLTNDKTMVYSSAIELGKDPETPAGKVEAVLGKAGVVMSNFPGAPTGPHNVCFLTGAPIPCSGSVKASI